MNGNPVILSDSSDVEINPMSGRATVKEALHALAEQLPANATWKDVAYEAYVREEIEQGLSEAQAGDFASDDEVRNTFAQWGVQLAD